jgi:hypothetical protein
MNSTASTSSSILADRPEQTSQGNAFDLPAAVASPGAGIDGLAVEVETRLFAVALQVLEGRAIMRRVLQGRAVRVIGGVDLTQTLMEHAQQGEGIGRIGSLVEHRFE